MTAATPPPPRDGEVPDFRPRGWVTRTEHGSRVATLRYADGSVGAEHYCTRERDGMTLLIAPRLQTDVPNGHRVVNGHPLTITPSILCPDCGLHGFITDGVWRSV